MDFPSKEDWMRKALELAAQAQARGEVPIGALVVRRGELIATGYNLRESLHRPTAHAEILAIEAAAENLKAWRLSETQLYVTLEPCLMCWGAIVLARIPELVFGAYDPKAGVCGSVLALHEAKIGNHFPRVTGGVLAERCGAVLSDFFADLRKKP